MGCHTSHNYFVRLICNPTPHFGNYPMSAFAVGFWSQACKSLQGSLAHTLTPEACSSFLQVRAPWLARSAPRKVRARSHTR